ncbi:MAG TPA: acid phosphatase [Prevotellaceae bacterium]|nr:acid phosphatase [Prevotellaceae bacterium]
MKRKALMAAAVLCSVGAWAQKSVTEEKFAPFYTTDQAPRMENVIPAPPSLTDARFFDDWTQYQWGKSVRGTERGRQAIADADLCAKYFLERFGAVMGRDMTPDTYPELFRLISRLHLTEQQAGASAKKYFHRVRPYQQFQEPTSVPQYESKTDFTSYPSGHTHVSWLVGLTLTAIDPAHTEQIMKVAYELGQSRVIVGFHYQSDVDMGRVMGSVTFARLWADESFQKMFDKARREFSRNGKAR